jgi:NAD(P)H-dependent flavin oxidoreductase YrpB (nitropropane dioxygenase family)
MLRTRVTREYAIDFPFVSAGMGFVALPELVAAVSSAGGLGLLGVGVTPPRVLATDSTRRIVCVHHLHRTSEVQVFHRRLKLFSDRPACPIA